MALNKTKIQTEIRELLVEMRTQDNVDESLDFYSDELATIIVDAILSTGEYLVGLPEAVDGVVTLIDNYTYLIFGTIDLNGARIVAGRNVSIFGYGTENCIIKSTGLTNNYLLTSNYSIQLNFITLTANKCLNLDATGNTNQAIDWFRVNFTDCVEVGLIKNYTNCIFETLGFLSSNGLKFEGIIGTIAFSNTIFTGTGTGTSIILPSTLTITRRFRIIYSSFVTFGSQIGIDEQGANIPVEGFILDTINFSGGGTYLQGISNTSNLALISNSKGISNSANIGQYYMQNSATSTTISIVGTFVKVAGTTTPGVYIEKFTHTNNRLTYVGVLIGYFRISGVVTFTSGNNNVIALRVAKNGGTIVQSESESTANGTGRSENIKFQDIVELNTNDYIEIWVTNKTGTMDVTVENLNLICERLN